MTFFRKTLFLFAALVMLFSLAACADNEGDIITNPGISPTDAAVTDDASDDTADTGADGHEGHNHADFVMDYSAGLDEHGYWTDVIVYDYIEPFNYTGIEIPYDTHTATDAKVQSEIDFVLDSFKTAVQVMNRAVADGDTVNIDYVGSVDGVEFVGGSTGGAGTEVIIGVTPYIDDFLAQIVGHMPGDTFDINVTFPEDYGTEELNGKDAVFVTTVNYISESVRPELTDEFVLTYLIDYGWTTVAELKVSVAESISSRAITGYIQNHIIDNMIVKSIPASFMRYQEDALINYYADYAASFNMELEPFITSLLGLESIEALLETSAAELESTAIFLLAIQAIAEDLEIKITEADLKEYFLDASGADDYSEFESIYGRPYLAQAVLSDTVVKYLVDNAVFLEE